MIRYDRPTLGEKLKTVDFEKNWKKFPISLTDNTYFVPNSEANKTIDKRAMMSHDPSLYDYPDGKITSDTKLVAEARKPGLDVAEISQKVEKLVTNAKEALNNDAQNKMSAELAEKAQSKAMIERIAKQSTMVQNNSSKE